MKRRLIVITIILMLIALPYVLGQVVAPQSLTEGPSERRDLSNLPSLNVSAQAGNITQLNIDVLYITRSWQGYYGNVSGTITLDDADNNTFYNWTLTSASGEVFATRNESADFASVNCTNSSERANEEIFLGQQTADGDSVTNTFNGTSHPVFSVGTQSDLSGCYSTNAFINTGQSATDYYQVLLSDDYSNIVYTTIMDDDQIGFDGSTYDFQLLVGENGHNGDTATTTYYIWVELA